MASIMRTAGDLKGKKNRSDFRRRKLTFNRYWTIWSFILIHLKLVTKQLIDLAECLTCDRYKYNVHFMISKNKCYHFVGNWVPSIWRAGRVWTPKKKMRRSASKFHKLGHISSPVVVKHKLLKHYRADETRWIYVYSWHAFRESIADDSLGRNHLILRTDADSSQLWTSGWKHFSKTPVHEMER